MDDQDERLARLPKWARMRIDKLERDLAFHKSRLAAGPEDSDTFADPYSDAPRPLGRGTRIEFRTGPYERFLVHLDASGELSVMGSAGMAVMPQASNVVRVAQAQRVARAAAFPPVGEAESAQSAKDADVRGGEQT